MKIWKGATLKIFLTILWY